MLVYLISDSNRPLVIRSLRHIAHTNTAQLSCHAKRWSEYLIQFLSDLNNREKSLMMWIPDRHQAIEKSAELTPTDHEPLLLDVSPSTLSTWKSIPMIRSPPSCVREATSITLVVVSMICGIGFSKSQVNLCPLPSYRMNDVPVAPAVEHIYSRTPFRYIRAIHIADFMRCHWKFNLRPRYLRQLQIFREKIYIYIYIYMTMIIYNCLWHKLEHKLAHFPDWLISTVSE